VRAAYAVTRLGRAGMISLPKVSKIRPGDSVEIFFENGGIALQKYVPNCVFCGVPADREFRGRNMCSECVSAIRKLFS